MKQQAVTVPDLGGADDVEVIEVVVADGASVSPEQTLIVVESDKASMEIPAPGAGIVRGITVKVGDRVRQGDTILMLESVSGSAPVPAASAAEPVPEPVASAGPALASVAPAPEIVQPAAPGTGAGRDMALTIPDLGGASSVEVIELAVHVGDQVAEGAPLLVLEGDKASMELPAPAAGTVLALEVKVGSRVQGGQSIGVLRVAAASAAAPAATNAPPVAPVAASESDTVTGINRVLEKEQRHAAAQPLERASAKGNMVYAGPAVRQLARELGVTLAGVAGSGPKGRILKEDVQSWVKTRLAAAPASTATALPSLPEVDFAAFGPVETVALSNFQKATVGNMLRSWLNVPHVTQFDFADVTDLEAFRSGLKPEMQQRNNKLTPLAFLLVAVARALREHPRFNASLHPDGAQLVFKQYVHVGIAVDTPQGLAVPVIRDVNTKSMWELAAEARELAEKARNRKLKLIDMQGSCFTISSLGNIGGEGFTPIVNAPEVAILGVSKLAVRPVWSGTEFLPRKTLPLSLSYDHRVINGADAGQFMSSLVAMLADIRRLLL
ncbi:MAG: 2-oxo acid dehydrogenase subunit E2 [Gammaproteobacteria bacterium]|nr:2-oxo acid dehydrogenase subunit E2 [Gammaproteobacteria bacterium]